MAIPSKITLFINNDLYVKVEGLHDGLNPSIYFNAATITLTVKDRDGVAVPGIDGIVLFYVPASNGDYLGQIEDTFGGGDQFIGGGYTAFLEIAQGATVGSYRIPTSIKVRHS